MKLISGVALLAAASTFSAVTAAPAVEPALAVRAESGLEERTLWGLGGGWCVSVLGLFNVGNCGSWSQQNWYDYKNGCNKWGYNPQPQYNGGIWKYQWGSQWIQDINWQYYGSFWLPKDCTKWNFECPSPVVPKPSCPQSWLDGYHKACQKKGWQPHMWWDSSKNGYWFWFNGQFTFQASFTLTTSGYCVPKSVASQW